MTGSLRFAMAVALVTAAGAPLAAQSRATYHSATELVTLGVAVQGADEQYVTGLDADQFVVFEDGVRQTIRFFGPGELPLDLVILLDTSSSMTSSLPLVQRAAVGFAEAMRPGDRAAVMGVASGLRILQPLTSDVALVTAAIRSTGAEGRTALYAGLYVALTELERDRRAQRAPRRQAIVVLSDGLDNSSVFAFDELLTETRRSGVPIYVIAPRRDGEVRRERERAYGESTMTVDFELRTLAADTGARAFFPTQLSDLDGVYADIARELAHQYSLGYLSTNPRDDGRFRQLTVRVEAPGVSWRTRTGYLADGVGADTGGDRH